MEQKKVTRIVDTIFRPQMINNDDLSMFFLNHNWHITKDSQTCSYQDYRAPLYPEDWSSFDLTELKIFKLNSRTSLKMTINLPLFDASRESIFRRIPINWREIKSLPISCARFMTPNASRTIEIENEACSDEILNMQMTKIYNTNITMQLKLSSIWSIQDQFNSYFGLAPSLSQLSELNANIVTSVNFLDGEVVYNRETSNSLYGSLASINDIAQHDRFRLFSHHSRQYRILHEALGPISPVTLSNKCYKILAKAIETHCSEIDNLLFQFRINNSLNDLNKFSLGYEAMLEVGHAMRRYCDYQRIFQMHERNIMKKVLGKLKDSQADICRLVEKLVEKEDGSLTQKTKNILVTDNVCSLCIEYEKVAFYGHLDCPHLYILCNKCLAHLSDVCPFCRTKSQMKKLFFQSFNDEQTYSTSRADSNIVEVKMEN